LTSKYNLKKKFIPGVIPRVNIYMMHVDMNLDQNFTSITTGKVLPSELWMTNQPDNDLDDEICAVYSDFGNETYGFSDTGCKYFDSTLCEVKYKFLCYVHNLGSEKVTGYKKRVFAMYNI
jgi:hypothetical protein